VPPSGPVRHPHLRAAGNSPAGHALAVQLFPEDTFEGYVIDGVLGRGGTACVYRAHRADTPAHVLALKVLDQDHHDEVHLTRLLREFDFARRASHPHVVTMYECGPSWLTMQLAAGGTAMNLTSRRDRLTALAQIADALDHVHATGIVHCDVKPSNILALENFWSDGVILTDFGIARSMTEGIGYRPKNVDASLPYAAPEVLRGHAPSAASDEYSLACTAVELLTGSAPFKAKTAMALIAAQIGNPVPRYSRRFEWIPHSFDSILAKAMAKDPDRRYQSCSELIHLMTRSVG
jgi:serine/threonine protein kinase